MTRTAYNLSAFNPTAQEIHDVVTRRLPARDDRLGGGSQAPGHCRLVAGRRRRLRGAARLGFRASYDFRRAFDDYLIPTIRERYRV